MSESRVKIEESRPQRVRLTYSLSWDNVEQEVESPFLILVLANLTGSGMGKFVEFEGRKCVRIDYDNFDAVLAGFKPRVQFELGDKLTGDKAGGIVALQFERMEDFSPRNVAIQVPQLRKILESMDKVVELSNMLKTKLNRMLQELIQNPQSLQSAANALADEAGESCALIEKILIDGFGIRDPDEKLWAMELLSEFVKLVQSGDIPISQDTEKMLASYIMDADEALSAGLRQIMNHPGFREIEASWRGLQYLVTQTKECSVCRIEAFNVSKEELRENLGKTPDYEQDAILRKLQTEAYVVFGGIPPALLIGDYYFGNRDWEISLLERMSDIAAAIHAPFITAASPEFFSLESFKELNRVREPNKIFERAEYAKWREFRNHRNARYVYLCVPRFALRPAYANKIFDPDEPDEDEFVEGAAHNEYLWGNAAYALATRIAACFDKYGWYADFLGTSSGGLVEDLPLDRIHTKYGESTAKCPTEIPIADQRANELINLGFIPLCWHKRSAVASFFSAPSCIRSRILYDNEEDNTASLPAQLEHVLIASRFAQYIKLQFRDQRGSFKSAKDLQNKLYQWLMHYVINPLSPKSIASERRPLRMAKIDIEEISGMQSGFCATVLLQPEYRLPRWTAPLRITIDLK